MATWRRVCRSGVEIHESPQRAHSPALTRSNWPTCVVRAEGYGEGGGLGGGEDAGAGGDAGGEGGV